MKWGIKLSIAAESMEMNRRAFWKSTATFVGAVGLGGQPFRASALSSDDFRQFRIRRRGYRRLAGSSHFQRLEEWVRMDLASTALILCDVWDLHHCRNATDRVKEVAPQIDQVARYLRQQGCLIIHAPSSCMEFYANSPARLRAMAAPRASNIPKNIGQWCHWMPGGEEEKNYPIDQSDGGCDSDPVQQHQFRQKLLDLGKNADAPWTHQIDSIFIDSSRDCISDDGVEVWNILETHKITNVLLAGVHTNMCVLGRPFGLRQMAQNGKNVHLLRDLTDTMYNPQRAPYVSHFEGTRRIIDHIEKYVCPTTTSAEFLGGEPFRFSASDVVNL